MEKIFMTANDVREFLGISRTTAYQIINEMNNELMDLPCEKDIEFALDVTSRQFESRTYQVRINKEKKIIELDVIEPIESLEPSIQRLVQAMPKIKEFEGMIVDICSKISLDIESPQQFGKTINRNKELLKKNGITISSKRGKNNNIYNLRYDANDVAYLPGEVIPEKANEIGKVLCDKVLGDNYEYILTTHIDRGHIHNHILFNNVSFKSGKCYQSNKRTYHKIREFSDELCRENGLVVIDEFYESYKKKFKTRGKSYYEYTHFKKGTSWKSRLAFDNLKKDYEKMPTTKVFNLILQFSDYEWYIC